ncbi:MAG: DEAD/DEAH box helicase [Kiritimatiellaeota bacterium]|nr:DEAD/DEAH box helicase [Kiritimatiellota bacterium]
MILHLHWRDGRLYAWGEQVAGELRGGSCASRGKNPREGAHTARAAFSPFDPGAEKLRAVLGQVMCGVDVPPGDAVRLALRFPTVGRGKASYPLPSQDYLMGAVAHGEAPCATHDGDAVRYLLWKVTAVEVPWRSAFTLLCLIDGRQLSDGIFAAEEVLALAALFRYTGALVARGRYLPDIRRAEGGAYEAVWSPCIDGEEDGRIRQFAERLPWVALDASPTAAAVEGIVAEWLDRLVRVSVTTTLSRAYALRRQSYSAHDAWFTALRGESRVIRWEHADELDALVGQVAEWRQPAVGSRNRDERPAFALRPPRAAGEGERISNIQHGISNDQVECASDRDLSAHVPHPMFQNQDWFLEITFAEKDVTRLNENSLLALGQAALLFPPLGLAEVYADDGQECPSHLQECPACLGCRLEVAEAYAFLTSASALLTAAGYAVALPPEWSPDAQASIALTADVAPHEKGIRNEELGIRNREENEELGIRNQGAAQPWADARVDVRLRVTFDGEPVTQEELEALLAADSPLVFFRGKWMIADVRQLQNAWHVSKRQGAAETETALDAVRLALGTGDKRHGLPVASVRGHGWVRDLLGRLSGDEYAFGLLPPPDDFVGELRAYQARGFSWLVYLRNCGFGACLADDMGLGKTIQALAFLLHAKAHGAARPALVVGPMSVLGNWMREAQRFAPGLRCHLHHGALRWHGESFAREMRGMDVVVTSYNLLYRDYAGLRKVSWSCVLLDEAQNIKNPETHQAQAARALTADYRIALTGTPMENHVGDLWSIMDFLNPGILGKRAAFRDAFFRPIQSGTDPGARTRLRRITTPFILRRLKTDKRIISDLPEKVEAKVYCLLTREQARLYQDELDAFQRELDTAEGIGRRGLILATLTRLKQICNHPANYLGQAPGDAAGGAKRSGKLMRLQERLEEVFACGECALVFTQYAEMGHLLIRHLCQAFGRDMPYLHGGVPRAARDAMVRGFQETGTPQAFVLSLKAGGTGLNLTRASHVFHYDRWWNPAVENQATDRAHRIGQTQRVMVHKFICGGTLEDRIDAMIESKTALAAEIVTHGEHFLTELSNDTLRDLLKLEVGEMEDA